MTTFSNDTQGCSPAADNTLAQAMYDVTNTYGRSRLQRQRDRQARQLPYLLHRVEELQSQCEALQQQLALTLQQKAVFQQEALTLRNLIKLRDHSDVIAAAAASEAATTMLRGEVQLLREQVRELEGQKRRCLLQSEEACAAAEYFKRCLQRQEQQAAAPSSSGCGDAGCVVDKEDDVRRLCACLEGERRRSRLLEKKAASLQEALTTTITTTNDVTGACGGSALPFSVITDRGNSKKETGHPAQIASDPLPPSPQTPQQPTSTGVGVAVAVTEAARLQRFTGLLRSQNRLLAWRVSELAQRSVDYAAEVAALKLTCQQLQRGRPPQRSLRQENLAQ